MAVPRILLVTQQLRSVRSGVGTYARLLLEQLEARGQAPWVASYREELDPSIVPEDRSVDLGRKPRLDPTPGSFFTLGKRARKAALALRPELVHFLDAREAHALIRNRGEYMGEIVGTVHDDYACHAPRSPQGLMGSCADPLRRWLYYTWLRRLEASTYPGFSHLLVNSLATGRSIIEHYGLEEEIVSPITLTIRRNARGVAPIPLSGQPALLFAGGNHYRKGLDTLLHAMARLERQLPGARLHVVGQDPASRKLARLAASLGTRERVRFHGRVEPERMQAMMESADLFVMPSRREALGLVYLEAFEKGTPVIATNCGGSPELVTDKVSGLLVPPANPGALAKAILKLSRDEVLRRRLVRGGFVELERRSPERLADETIACYDSMLSKTPEPTRSSESTRPSSVDSAPTLIHAEPVDSST